jgi:hypothetical protein
MTTQSPTPRNPLSGLRINITQAAKLADIKMGVLIPMRSKGARLYDPTFPPMTNGTLDAAEVLAWKAARDAKANNPEGQKNV